MVSTLVTGDAVVLELPPAGVATRLVALVIDVVVSLIVLTALIAGLFILTVIDPALGAAISLAAVVLVLIIIPIIIETLSRGRSLGKLVMGLRVVRDDGGPIRTRHAVTRQLVGFGEFYVLYGAVTIFVVLANDRSKRLGDLLAGTYVINERTPMVATPMIPMPPELAGWAASTDIGRIPGPLALAARNFLSRAHTMTARSADELGTQLSADLMRLVAPEPPPGTSRGAFIAAVLAERRRRDLDRLRRERGQVDRLRVLLEDRRGRV